MITLTRLSGSVFALNSDLIERVDSTPDTVVTLVDGTKYVVVETLEEVISSVRQHRGEIIAISTSIEAGALAAERMHRERPQLRTVSPHPTASRLSESERGH